MAPSGMALHIAPANVPDTRGIPATPTVPESRCARTVPCDFLTFPPPIANPPMPAVGHACTQHSCIIYPRSPMASFLPPLARIAGLSLLQIGRAHVLNSSH